MECSAENPFSFGEELFFLNLNPTYTIVTKSFCIKVELPAQPLFGIFRQFSVREIKLMKKKCEQKIEKLYYLKEEKASC